MALTPSWYQPAALIMNLFLAMICVLFLLRPPKMYRTLAWWGLMTLAIGILLTSLRTLRRVALPGGILPRFSSDLDAVTSLLPTACFVTTITIFLVAAHRERKTPTVT